MLPGRKYVQISLPKLLDPRSSGPHTPVKQVNDDGRRLATSADEDLGTTEQGDTETLDDQCHGPASEGDIKNMPLCELNQFQATSPTVTAADVSHMEVWKGTWEDSRGLALYWAEGRCSPKPFDFCTGSEARFKARAEAFKKLERSYVLQCCSDAEGVWNDIGAPVSPRRPPMPALYHLREFGGHVTLPWIWDCTSGEDFVRNWEGTVKTEDFRDKLMRCAYWWIRRKVNG